MARTLVSLTEGVWTDLGTAEMVIEIKEQGEGRVFLNQAQDINSALTVPKGSLGAQFSNTKGTETIFARATKPGWVLVVDI